MDTAVNSQIVETVLPRPPEPLRPPALAAATKKWADKLAEKFLMEEEAAAALALATVDPASARKAAESPERLPVPGGIVLGVRTEVWSQLVMPDPRNPRIGPARRHPASNLVGESEATRFAPIPEPQPASGNSPHLVLRIRSQEHLAWAAKQALDYVLDQNDWRESIRNQGVMTEVWLTATRFEHGNGHAAATVPVTAEGSSRMTAVHHILGIRSADVPYIRDERKLRAHIRRLNAQLDTLGADELDVDSATRLRCEAVPALLLVGFEPHGGITADFAVAVKSLVALRHVDFPKPWGEATENEALGDAVIAELERRGLITGGEADWLAGSLTPEDAVAAGFSAEPSIRAARIVRLFTDGNPKIHEAVRIAITTQSTRKRITSKLLFQIATSLILRSVPEEDARKRERVRRYLKEAYSGELTNQWDATFRSGEALTEVAIAELTSGEAGPASRELAARSAYPLVVTGGLVGDQGTVNSEQPDRRKPGEVIDRMRVMEHGLHQLGRSVTDFEAGRRLRLVDEAGVARVNEDGRELFVRDPELRRTFAAAGRPNAVPAAETAAERLHNSLSSLGGAIQAVAEAVKAVEASTSEDGTPTIEEFGAEPGHCAAWQSTLFGVLQKLPVWEQRHLARNGSAHAPGDMWPNSEELEDDEDHYEEGDDE